MSDDVEDLAQAVHAIDARPQTFPGPIPDYQPILIGATVLQILMAIFIVLGIGALMLGIIECAFRPQTRYFPCTGLWSLLLGAALALAAWGIAAILLMLAHLALAIRDIARNSFRRSNHD